MKAQLMRGAVRGILGARTLVNLVGRKRRGGVDAALDPQIAAILELERIAHIPALDTMQPAAARSFAEAGLSPLDPTPATMATVADITVPGPAGPIAVRIYTPPHAGPHWIVYFHGGGGVIGSIAASDAATRTIALHSRCTVASVEYRLGPEHKHPAALDDAIAAYEALVARVPAGSKIATAGDSFGGYLAAAVDYAVRARQAVRPPDLQVLIYPVVDFTHAQPSITRNAHGYLLTRELVEWFHRHYFGPDTDVRAASPWFYPSLRGSAPALVLTAGYDPLVDEGDAYAERLRSEGVTVRHRRHTSLVHGFISMTGAVDAARGAVVEMCADLAAMLAG